VLEGESNEPKPMVLIGVLAHCINCNGLSLLMAVKPYICACGYIYTVEGDIVVTKLRVSHLPQVEAEPARPKLTLVPPGFKLPKDMKPS
jgi:hypothetical protein